MNNRRVGTVERPHRPAVSVGTNEGELPVWELLVALLLLAPTPPSVPSHAPEPLWQALKQVALELEVVGPHERWANDFRSELGYVRRHWRELAQAPPLADCSRLPSAELATFCCRLN